MHVQTINTLGSKNMMLIFFPCASLEISELVVLYAYMPFDVYYYYIVNIGLSWDWDTNLEL